MRDIQLSRLSESKRKGSTNWSHTTERKTPIGSQSANGTVTRTATDAAMSSRFRSATTAAIG